VVITVADTAKIEFITFQLPLSGSPGI